MKRICYMLLAAALLAAGCTKEVEGNQIDKLEIGISDSDTKVSLGAEYGGKINILWSEGDEVSVKGDAGESIYRLTSGAGSVSGVFVYKSGAKGHTQITDVIYPATNSGTVPVAQNYKAGTFDPTSITLAYHNPSGVKGTPIQLKSESSVLCFQLKGTDKLTSVKVGFKGGKTYTLNVPSVQLKSTAMPFYVVVPSQNADRANVTFASASGSMNRILLSKSFVSGKVHRFAALDYKADKKYRIMTYNIGQCSQGGNSSPEVIAKVVKELKADVVVMNEVKSAVLARHNEKIAEALGWKQFYRDGKSGLGNMITYNLAKLKQLGESYLDLKNIKNDEKYNEDRVCLFMEFEDFVLVGSHLEKDDFPAHAKSITDKVKSDYATKGKPVFFCGDMNTRPYMANMNEFTSEWRPLSRMDQATFYNSEQPDNLICIDYIFLWKGGPDVNVTKTEICKSVNCCNITDASDHFPVYVDVAVGNSSLPLLESDPSLDKYNVVEETTW